jgi:N-methylhydantoinase A/oxoprolinase/acetone carboxylase beta subunit
LMHAYAYAGHENLIETIARTEFGFNQVSISSKVMPRVKLVKIG